MRLLTATAVLAVTLWPATAVDTSAAGAPRVTGPGSVVPGVVVSFRAHGFRAGSLLEVVVAPTDKGPCCAARIPSSFSVSALGDASLTFKMPLVYRRCLSASGPCRKVRWSRHERVAVTAFGYLQDATTHTSVAR